MATVAIIQARMCSTRLPGKVLADLAGREVLWWVIDAAAAIPRVDSILVATSTAREDDVVAGWCAQRGIAVFRGSETDVLNRYVEAAHGADADLIVRITADCPLLDPEEAGKVLAPVIAGTADYASNVDPPTYPDGLDCEAFTRDALDKTARAATKPSDREHVTPYMRDPTAGFRIARVQCPMPSLSDERWTIDTAEDLAFLRAILLRLGRRGPFRYYDILAILDREPELRALNRHERRNAGYTRSLAQDQLAGQGSHGGGNARR